MIDPEDIDRKEEPLGGPAEQALRYWKFNQAAIKFRLKHITYAKALREMCFWMGLDLKMCKRALLPFLKYKYTYLEQAYPKTLDESVLDADLVPDDYELEALVPTSKKEEDRLRMRKHRRENPAYVKKNRKDTLKRANAKWKIRERARANDPFPKEDRF